eukprot:2468197-Rhodomonas_salina.2
MSVSFPRRRDSTPLWRMSADDNKPKRVAIIGSGLAGLALAIALEKLPTGVETVKVSYSLGLRARDAIYRTDTCYAALKIFERTGQLRPNVGGGLQINGAVSVLSRYFQQTFNRLTMSLTRHGKRMDEGETLATGTHPSGCLSLYVYSYGGTACAYFVAVLVLTQAYGGTGNRAKLIRSRKVAVYAPPMRCPELTYASYEQISQPGTDIGYAAPD